MPETTTVEKKPQGINFTWFLQQISLSAFINTFLMIRYRGALEKWQLRPKQKEFCAFLDEKAKIRNAVVWLLKSRQIGCSTLIAAYLILKCMANPGYQCLVLSKTGTDAVKFIKRKVEPLLLSLQKWAPGIPWCDWDATQQKVTFSNGSEIEAMNCSNHASRGEIYDIIVLDEAAFGEFVYSFEEIWQSITGTTEHAGLGLVIVMSTSVPGTYYNARTIIIYREGVRGVYFYFLPLSTMPERLKDKAWKEERIEKLGEVGFKQEFPDVPEDAFLSKEGYGFPQFERPPGRHVKELKLSWKWQYWMVYDHGKTRDHPAMMWHLLYNPRNNHCHVFHEQFWSAQGLDRICLEIKVFQTKIRAEGAPKPQRCIADTAITMDDTKGHEQRKSIRDIIFRETKLYFTGCLKKEKKTAEDWFIMRVNRNKITFDPQCRHSIRQIQNILWDTKKSNYGKLVDLDNEAIDLGTYFCAEVEERMPKHKEETVPMKAYDPKAKKYRKEHSIFNKRGQRSSISHDYGAM